MNEHWMTMPVKRGFKEIKPLYDAIRTHGYIAGSYAAWMAAPERDGDGPMKPGDIDVFAKSEKSALYCMHACQDMLHLLFYYNGITYTSFNHIEGKQVQIVRPSPEWKQFPDDIMNSFDMDICRALLVNPNTVWADENVGLFRGKLLRINNPARSLKRVLKYHRRGVDFDDWELLKLFRAWDELPGEAKVELIKRARPVTRLEQPVDLEYELDDDNWFEGE